MKNLLACLAILFAINAPAQVVYPYNPDANGDSQITSGDLLDFLPVFATSFTPQVITVDGVPLGEWLANLEGVVNSNAASIESLFAMQAQINSLEAANSDLQNQINSLQDQLGNLSFDVDGLPPCIDLDDDGICDFADACAPPVAEFQVYNEENGELTTGEVLLSGSYSNFFMVGQDCSASCLQNLTLSNGYIHSSNLQGIRLVEVIFEQMSIYDCNLSQNDCQGFYLYYSSIEDVSFSNANMNGATLRSDFMNCDFTNADLTNTDWEDSSTYQCNFEGADLTGANLSNGQFVNLITCPSHLPTGYVCTPMTQPDLGEYFEIVPE